VRILGKDNRADGYINMLNKVGTNKDPLENYEYVADPATPDFELAQIYAADGLFSKIVDIPAEAAFKYGYEIEISDPDVKEFVTSTLEELNFNQEAIQALKWSRLFGGSVILMLVDDGLDLDEPLNWDAIEGINQLLIFERPEVQPEYESTYMHTPDQYRTDKFKFGQPEYYRISPIYGGTPFRVHESRLLIFKNGVLPRTGATDQQYMFFGAPEYNRIKRELRDSQTTHGNGYRLLERCVQAVYKVQNLAAQLATPQGEEDIINRMGLIDRARSLLNTMMIDADGEDYAFQTFQLSGVKDIIDESCQLLSAVTNIPQTVLFGRSPAGQNSTGESDLTNYYDYINQIQERGLKNNIRTLIDIILAAGVAKGNVEVVQSYTLKFNPLWNLSDREKAEVRQMNTAADLTKAQAAQAYVDMQALDASEVRKSLAKEDDYEISEILAEEDVPDMEFLAQLMAGGTGGNEGESYETSETGITEMSEEVAPEDEEQTKRANTDQADYGVGLIVVRDGKILCGKRKDNGQICGPGGHIEEGELPEAAVIREAQEEFDIVPKGLVHIGNTAGAQNGILPARSYLCQDFEGLPICDNNEMEQAQWRSYPQLMCMELHPAFKESLEILANVLGGG